MREIKFRAWFSKKNEMVLQVGVFPTHRNAPTYSISSDGVMVRPDAPDIILMQYTSLKDKNGKEIYEGDIVKKYGLLSQDDPAYGFYEPTYTMVYMESCAGFGLQLHNPKEILVPTYLELEIIGNIYENPELNEVKA
jgi:uncharacterized phage protein (TIGR01671 family)